MSSTTVYRVDVTREGRWWAIEVPELPGGFSQARGRGEVPIMARDLIACLLDVKPRDVAIDVHYPPD